MTVADVLALLAGNDGAALVRAVRIDLSYETPEDAAHALGFLLRAGCWAPAGGECFPVVVAMSVFWTARG